MHVNYSLSRLFLLDSLRGRDNILKRLLIHIGAFNLGLVLRKMLGAGTPRELKNRAASSILRLFEWLACRHCRNDAAESRNVPILALFGNYRTVRSRSRLIWNLATCTTGGYDCFMSSRCAVGCGARPTWIVWICFEGLRHFTVSGDNRLRCTAESL
jgi:hypothetical protein